MNAGTEISKRVPNARNTPTPKGSGSSESGLEARLANQVLNQTLLELLVDIADGEQAAFSQLYNLTNRAVFGLALRILGDRETAEEVTLDVFMQVWRQAAHYDLARGTPLAWLMMMTRSRAIDRLRSATHRTHETDDLETVSLTTAAREENPEEASIFAERRKQVRAALDKLTKEQRVLIETAFFEGLSHAEIAERFQLPLGTVKTRIRAGMLVLRKHLPEQ